MARVCACDAGTQLDIADAARISREISEAEDNSDAASARTARAGVAAMPQAAPGSSGRRRR